MLQAKSFPIEKIELFITNESVTFTNNKKGENPSAVKVLCFTAYMLRHTKYVVIDLPWSEYLLIPTLNKPELRHLVGRTVRGLLNVTQTAVP